MKMTMVLLVATAALLVSADAAAIDRWMAKTDNRNKIIYLTDNFNESNFKEEFVADVVPLAGECGSKFFCKVTDVLDNKTFSTWPEKEELVENLKMYNKQEHLNCTEMLKDLPSNGVKIQMVSLIRHLKHCMQQKNWTKMSKP